MTAEEFIKDNTIADENKIHDALCMPESARGIFKSKPLVPIGVGVWKGDKMPGTWSMNDKLEKGAVYPIYSNEGRFIIGNDGKGLKFNVQDWKQLVWF